MTIDRIPIPISTGALWLTSRLEVAPDPEAALARANHASTIVCLNEPHELEQRFPDYVEWLMEHDGDRAIWFPTVNFEAGNLARALPVIEQITERLRDRRGVVIHCAMGQGRAGTMAVCVLMALGASMNDALKTVAAHRTFAGPGGASQWALIEALDRRLSGAAAHEPGEATR